MPDLPILLIYAGMYPYWVFLVFLVVCLIIWRRERVSSSGSHLTSQSLLTGMLATLTSLSRVWKTEGSLCVICGGSAINRGWPLPWYGREVLDALGAPVDLAIDIGFWWLGAVLLLWGARWLQQRIPHPLVQRILLPLAAATLIVVPLVLLFLPLQVREIGL